MTPLEVRRIVVELVDAVSAWSLANSLADRSEIGSHTWKKAKAEAAEAKSAMDALTTVLAIGSEGGRS